MEQKEINKLMQPSPEWKQKFNCCANCEALEAENVRLRKVSGEAVRILQSVNWAEGTIPFKAVQALEG